MGILQVQNINLSFGDRELLKDVSLTLSEHARAALAGGNGEGKTTLMKIIAGLMTKDDGTITKTKDMRISYLPQSDIVFRDNTVYKEIEKAYARFDENLRRQHEIENMLESASNDSLLFELNILQETLLESPYYNRKAQIYDIAKGLGFSATDLERPCCEFSGGFQMRIALAKVLAEAPDLMMLDEPTNYLDIEARTWLKEFLKKFKGSLLIVCHDKGFMDDTVNEVYELFNSRLTRYSGNYSFYEKQRKTEIHTLENAYRKQQEEIEKTEQFIERFRYKATKAKQVQSRVKQLDKIEHIVVPSHLKTLRFSFPEPPHSPNDMVVIENLCKTYNRESQNPIKVFENFSMIITKGQKIAVTGHNGIGKSTLLRIIAQQDSDYSGTARLGSGVKTGYYSQDTADSLNMDNSVIEEVLPYGNEAKIRNALGSFLFSGDDIYKEISVLSGGERSRLSLLKILLQPACLLILDEPTNHLDINAKDMLLKALKEYNGTIVFVSHDAYFIKGLADRVLYLSEDKPEFFNGDYDYFEWKMSHRLGLDKEPKPEISKTSSKIDRLEENRKRNQLNRQKKELQALLTKIEELEGLIAESKAQMNLPENYSDPKKAKSLSETIEKLEILKSECEEEWLLKSES